MYIKFLFKTLQLPTVLTSTYRGVPPKKKDEGFTMIEILVVMGILCILVFLSLPLYNELRNKAKVSVCMEDLRTLEKEIYAYSLSNGSYPVNLTKINRGEMRDPWGNLYIYDRIPHSDGTDAYVDTGRHDINTDFDLYSKGKDGASTLDLTDSSADDDIIHGANGGYVGLGSNY